MAWYMKVFGHKTWASCWNAESIGISKGENYVFCRTKIQDELDSLVNLRSTNFTWA
jgi:hypothetical protein